MNPLRLFGAVWALAAMAAVVKARVPEDLSNFQNEFVCDHRVRLVRPKTIEDLQEAVRVHDHISAVGVGHSWNKPFFCAPVPDDEDDERVPVARRKKKGGKKKTAKGTKIKQLLDGSPTSANLAMTTMRPLEIDVCEQLEAAWVDAGVKVWDLLRYLGNYVTEEAPAGYTLPAAPWFVFQTIAGAIATNTHGSHLQHNSVSDQVLAFRVVLANGTHVEITPESHPFEMKAMRVSVGRLGVITSVMLRIVKEVPVKRSVRRGIVPAQFVQMLKEAQEMYKQDRSLPEWMTESQVFWLVQIQEFMFYNFQRGDVSDPAVRQKVLKNFKPENTTQYRSLMEMLEVEGDPKVPASDDMILANGVFKTAQEFITEYNQTEINERIKLARKEKGLDVADGVEWEEPKKKLPNYLYSNEASANPLFLSNIHALTSLLGNETVEAHLSYISMPEPLLASLVEGTLYDQYEVAVPIDRVGDCMESVMEMMYEGDLDGQTTLSMKDQGFRTAPLIRFIGKEDGLLSLTNDMPRMYINMEDYLFYNKNRTRNEAFFKVIAHFRGHPSCQTARLHWGKAGWPDKGCWHGASEFPDTWCDFGCAVKKLDPQNKFRDSAPDRWNWKGADLDYCCTENGYDRTKPGCTCNVERVKPLHECPPPPFYSNR